MRREDALKCINEMAEYVKEILKKSIKIHKKNDKN